MIKGNPIWVVFQVTYLKLFLKWTEEGLTQKKFTKNIDVFAEILICENECTHTMCVKIRER